MLKRLQRLFQFFSLSNFLEVLDFAVSYLLEIFGENEPIESYDLRDVTHLSKKLDSKFCIPK